MDFGPQSFLFGLTLEAIEIDIILKASLKVNINIAPSNHPTQRDTDLYLHSLFASPIAVL